MFGSQPVSSGYNYFGSLAFAIAVGPITEPLIGIWNGDTNIWSGSVNYLMADSEGKVTLTTSIGLIDFFFGLSTQEPSSAMALLTVDYGAGPVPALIPAYRRIAYAVCRDVAFGTQVAPPTLLFDIGTRRDALPLSSHILNYDITVPEVMYYLLTDTFDGAGIDPINIDITSFADAGNTTFGEVMVSLGIDATTTLRDMLTQLQTYIDARLVFAKGKITLRLIRRQDSSGAQTISEADLMDEPKLLNGQYDDTWNKTIVTFNERPASSAIGDWDPSSVPYFDDANAAIVQQTVEKTFNFPMITQRSQARTVARRIGIRGGLPAMTWTMQLKPKWRTLIPGDLVKFSYAKFGKSNVVLRVQKVTRGTPSRPAVDIVAQEENIPDQSILYSPVDPVPVPETNVPVSTTTRLSWLPTALRPSDKPDGFLLAMNRPDGYTIGGSVWWTYDALIQPYIKVMATITGFPAKGTLIAWHRLANGNWTFRVQMDTAQDASWLTSLITERGSINSVVGERAYKTVGVPKNVHQVLSPWQTTVTAGRFVALGSRVYDIELQGGTYGTDNFVLETLADDAKYPTQHIYFGRQPTDFFIYPTEHYWFALDVPGGSGDVAYIRHIKATMKNHKAEQILSDVTDTTYARHDATMNPLGTYSRDWGALVKTTYQVYDEAAGGLDSTLLTSLATEVDAALNAFWAGGGTADQHAMYDDVNALLGAMLSGGYSYYNSVP